MVRALMLVDLHNWTPETAFVRYLEKYPDLVDALGFEKCPVRQNNREMTRAALYAARTYEIWCVRLSHRLAQT
jgi:hypothetical protein